MDIIKVKNSGASLILAMVICLILSSVILTFNIYLLSNMKNISNLKNIDDVKIRIERVDIKYD